MKTLKQLLNDSGYTPTALAPDELTHWNEEQFIIKIVKEWLTQKHREHKCGDFCCMEELLEELNQ